MLFETGVICSLSSNLTRYLTLSLVPFLSLFYPPPPSLPLTTPSHHSLSPLPQIQLIPRGAVVIRQGSPVKGLHILLDGEARSLDEKGTNATNGSKGTNGTPLQRRGPGLATSEGGVTLCTLAAGAFLGEANVAAAIKTGRPQQETVVASSDCRVMFLSKDGVNKFLGKSNYNSDSTGQRALAKHSDTTRTHHGRRKAALWRFRHKQDAERPRKVKGHPNRRGVVRQRRPKSQQNADVITPQLMETARTLSDGMWETNQKERENAWLQLWRNAGSTPQGAGAGAGSSGGGPEFDGFGGGGGGGREGRPGSAMGGSLKGLRAERGEDGSLPVESLPCLAAWGSKTAQVDERDPVTEEVLDPCERVEMKIAAAERKRSLARKRSSTAIPRQRTPSSLAPLVSPLKRPGTGTSGGARLSGTGGAGIGDEEAVKGKWEDGEDGEEEGGGAAASLRPSVGSSLGLLGGDDELASRPFTAPVRKPPRPIPAYMRVKHTVTPSPSSPKGRIAALVRPVPGVNGEMPGDPPYKGPYRKWDEIRVHKSNKFRMDIRPAGRESGATALGFNDGGVPKAGGAVRTHKLRFLGSGAQYNAHVQGELTTFRNRMNSIDRNTATVAENSQYSGKYTHAEAVLHRSTALLDHSGSVKNFFPLTFSNTKSYGQFRKQSHIVSIGEKLAGAKTSMTTSDVDHEAPVGAAGEAGEVSTLGEAGKMDEASDTGKMGEVGEAGEQVDAVMPITVSGVVEEDGGEDGRRMVGGERGGGGGVGVGAMEEMAAAASPPKLGDGLIEYMMRYRQRRK